MNKWLIMLIIGAGLMMGACLTSVIPDPAPAKYIYQLQTEGETVVSRDDAVIIRIDRPTAPKIMLGQNILASPDGQKMIIVAGSEWSEPIPAMIQYSFFDTLSTRENLVGVLPTSGARTAYRVHLTIRHFEAQFDQGEDNAPLAIVDYTATVSHAGTRDLISTKSVKITERASAPSVSAIVSAQTSANQSALNDIANWLESLNLSPNPA